MFRAGLGLLLVFSAAWITHDLYLKSSTTMTLQAKQLRIGNRSVHLFSAGPEEGQAILLFHGARFTSQTWQELGILEMLAKAGFRVFAVDTPGYGQSQSSSLSHGEWLSLLFAALGAQRPVLIAPSMSGSFVLPYVLEHAGQVQGLITLAPVEIPKYRNRLQDLSIPVLGIWGEKDQIVPVEIAKTWFESSEQGRLIVLQGARHPCYLDQPAKFHQEILKFLRTELP